jgi:2-methylcitrate dehydratase PrpD
VSALGVNASGVSEDRTIVQHLAAFAARCRDEGVSEPISRDVTGRVLDIIGLALAADTVAEAGGSVTEAVASMASVWGGTGQSTAIGVAEKLPAPSAALINGTRAHALDFDDTHLPSVLHPSASVVPAALAAAEAANADGPTLLAAIAAGVEITNRLGMGSYDRSINNSVFFEHGLHATSICGTVGSAVAAAMIAGLDVDGIAHAMGIAASMGAGLIEANRTGGTVKRIHCGWAAHSGLVAAAMAAGGITGPPTVFEGRFGFFEGLSRGFLQTDAVISELGMRWELLRTFFKPYPTNHFTHAGIDAALAMRAYGLDPADIIGIELGAPAPVLRTIAEPVEEKAKPRSGYHGKFSGPFTVAVALLGGGGLGVALDDFSDERAQDAEHLRLAGLVRCVADEEATTVFPNQFPGVLRVTTKGGSLVEHRVRYNRGGPENPLSLAELGIKFATNAERALGPAQAARVRAAVEGLATASTLAS